MKKKVSVVTIMMAFMKAVCLAYTIIYVVITYYLVKGHTFQK